MAVGAFPTMKCWRSQFKEGVVRHADAGYDSAIDLAKQSGIKMPMLKV
jgi:urocanate hydratase